MHRAVYKYKAVTKQTKQNLKLEVPQSSSFEDGFFSPVLVYLEGSGCFRERGEEGRRGRPDQRTTTSKHANTKQNTETVRRAEQRDLTAS